MHAFRYFTYTIRCVKVTCFSAYVFLRLTGESWSACRRRSSCFWSTSWEVYTPSTPNSSGLTSRRSSVTLNRCAFYAASAPFNRESIAASSSPRESSTSSTKTALTPGLWVDRRRTQLNCSQPNPNRPDPPDAGTNPIHRVKWRRISVVAMRSPFCRSTRRTVCS